MLKPGANPCPKLDHVLRALFQFMADIFKITSQATKPCQLKVNDKLLCFRISVVWALRGLCSLLRFFLEEVGEERQLDTSVAFPQNASLLIQLFYSQMYGILPNKSVRKVEIPNKYAKYTAVNLLANWNIDKFTNVFKIFELNFKKR